MINKSTKSGFTLVEAVVVGVLISVLALGAFSLFSMYTKSQSETAANLRLQRWAETLTDEISREVRNSAFVSVRADDPLPDAANEDDNTFFETTFNEEDDEGNVIAVIKQIFIRDTAGVVLSHFQFRDDGNNVGTVLKDGVPFTLGDIPVQVVFGSSNFELRVDCRQVRINMKLRTASNNDDTFTLNVQRGVFRCRN